MSIQVQHRRGNTTQTAAFTGAVGEITVDTDKNTVVVHDGSTPGGRPLAPNTAFDVANAAFGSANNVAPQVAPAFNTANAAYTNSNTAFNVANAAFGVANNAYTTTNGAAAFAFANGVSTNTTASFGLTNTVYAAVNSAFAVINAAYTSSNADYVVSNASFTVANAAFGFANSSNTWVNSTFLKLTSSSQTITGDLTITGNIVFGGNATSITSNNLVVNDSLIYLANNNPADILDIGFIGSYINATSANAHTGLFRDHATKQYYLFQGYDADPERVNDIVPYSNNMVNSVLIADFNTSNLTLGGANAIVWIKSAYDTVNAAYTSSNADYTVSNAAFGVANAAYGNANNLAVSANNYAGAMANSGNVFTGLVYTAVNSSFGVANAAFARGNTSAQLAYFRVTANGTNLDAVSNADTLTIRSSNNIVLIANSTNDSLQITQSPSGVTATTYGGATQIPVLAVDAFGRITSAANAAVQGMNYAYANTIWGVANGKVETVTSNSTSRIWANTVTVGSTETVYLDLATSGVTASAYSSGISAITVDAYGRVTSVTGSAGYVTSSGVTSVATGTGLTGGTITTTGTLSVDFATVATVTNAAAAFAAANSKVASVSGTSGRITSSGGTAPAIDLATAGAGAASYSSGISALTVDAYGRVTSVTGSAGYVSGSFLANTSGTSYNGTLNFPTGNVIIGTTSATTRLYVQGSSAGAATALVDGATITPNFASNNNFTVTLAGNRTMANPSNMTVGQGGIIWITQDGTGGRTLTWGNNWRFIGNSAPILSTGASAVDAVLYTVRSATSITCSILNNIG